MFGGISSGLIGTVSVTTIPSIGASWDFSSAGPQNAGFEDTGKPATKAPLACQA